MEIFIGKKVFSRFYKSGVIEDVIQSGEKYQLIVKFEGRQEPLKFGFFESISNGLLWFVDSEVQNIAIGMTDGPTFPTGNDEITAEIDILNCLNSLERESIDIRTDFGRIELLKKNFSYGTNGQEIYKKCCESFHWDYSLKGFFAPLKIMYARNAKKHYSVWMLPHSNFTGDVAESGKWENYIIPPYIWEKYNYDELPLVKGDKRITFVKMRNEVSGRYEYVFLGIYQSFLEMKSNDGKLVLKYRRIAEEYPE